MICNSSLTVYHKIFDETSRLERWVRFNYNNVWFFGGKGAGINKGYNDANDFDCRIPYDQNDVDITNFSIGDIVVQGTLTTDIQTQQDLPNNIVYNIKSINNNNFGNNQHIHIGGK